MNKLTIITSTGRTGTQFFEYFVNDCTTNALCLHEPHPSRRFKFYSNMLLQKRISKKTVGKQFLKLRNKHLLDSSIDHYLESSNFLFGCIPSISCEFPNLKILHIVREPKSYVISHLNKGFWRGHKKIFAKYVPFWLEKLSLPKGEASDPVKTLASRWVYVNQVIASYKKDPNIDYLLLRFEDLFAKEPKKSADTLQHAIQFLGLKVNDIEKAKASLSKPRNASRDKHKKYTLTAEQEHYIDEVCAELKNEFGYA